MKVVDPELKKLIESIAQFADPKVRKTVAYIAPDLTIKLTRRLQPDRRSRQIEWVLTSGKPNYEEREFIKKLRKVGEPFPVKKIQLKFYPEKRK